jgi:hypothetical protein
MKPLLKTLTLVVAQGISHTKEDDTVFSGKTSNKEQKRQVQRRRNNIITIYAKGIIREGTD